MNVMFPELNDTCVLDGDIWTNGSTWWKNECIQCSCVNGLSFCAEKSPQCPELPESCHVTRVPQGKCCPVCVGEFNTGDEMLGLNNYLLCFI
jgi:von Willebrand factor type C domain.